MLALFETLFDIIRLRKGPDAIPHSATLLTIVIALWLFAGSVMTIMTPEFDQNDLVVGTVTGIAGLACYTAIITLSGRGARLLRALVAIIGCGAVLSLMSVAGNVFLSPFLSANITNLVVTLILLWSIPVEGHIISRTIERHWYFGIVIAVAVFIFQLILYSLIDPTVGTAA